MTQDGYNEKRRKHMAVMDDNEGAKAMAAELKPCPFCGSSDVTTHLDREQGEKWGYANCDACAARGPEVRTSYDRGQGAPWRLDAAAEWNTRTDLSRAAIAAAMMMAADALRQKYYVVNGKTAADFILEMTPTDATAALEAMLAQVRTDIADLVKAFPRGCDGPSDALEREAWVLEEIEAAIRAMKGGA